jgi:hypothetical protein
MWGAVDRAILMVWRPGDTESPGRRPRGPEHEMCRAAARRTFTDIAPGAWYSSASELRPAQSTARVRPVNYRDTIDYSERTPAGGPTNRLAALGAAPCRPRHRGERQIHLVNLHGLGQPGRRSAERGHRLHDPRFDDQPAVRGRDAEGTIAKKGTSARTGAATSSMAQTHRCVRQISRARAMRALASGWRLSGVYVVSARADR